MYSIEILLVWALVALLIGLGLGALAARRWWPQNHQRNLEEHLHKAQREMEAYQHEVAKHFVETSARISDLTQSYKELHEHLAQGAATLASPDISRSLLEAATQKLEAKPVIYDEASIEPPKDWAPKVPGVKGALSEDYGLHDAEEESKVYSSVTPLNPR